MLLAIISDVHCGPMFRRAPLRVAIGEINEIRPDAVLITGDLTENGLMSEFKMAQRELGRLKSQKKILISGNHNHRSTGYLLFREYFPFQQVTEIDDRARYSGDVLRSLTKSKANLVLCGHRH